MLRLRWLGFSEYCVFIRVSMSELKNYGDYEEVIWAPPASRLSPSALTVACHMKLHKLELPSDWSSAALFIVSRIQHPTSCVRLSYLTIASVFVGSIHSPHLLFSCRQGNTVPLHFVKFEKIGSWTEFHNLTEKSLGYKCLSGNSELRYVLAVSTNKLNLVLQCSFVCA